MIIAIAGLPGSGKSYFASQLAAILDAVYISSDGVRKAMDRLGKYSQKDKLTVYNEMAKLTAEAVLANRTVVADATFYHQEMRILFLKLASKYDTPIRFIMVHAREAVIKERLRKPRPDSEADFKVYELVKQSFEEITFPHLKLESTNSNLDDMLKKATEYIRTAHEGRSSLNTGRERLISR